MQGSVAVLEQARSILEQLTTTRGRFVMSTLVVVATVVVAALIVPYVVGTVRDLVDSRFLSGRFGESVDVVGDYLPRTFTEVLVRLMQLTVVVTMALALLVVWGMADVAIALFLGGIAAFPYLMQAAGTVALIVVALVGSDQLRHVIGGFSEGADRVTEHQEEILLRVGQLTLFVTTIALILGLWQVNLTGLLAGAGFLGIVVGFAARQTLGSLIAGFVLMFSRPFTIGDWVQIGEDEGIVTDITIFNTRLENFDGEFVILPNDKVSNSAVTNRSQKGLLRLRTDVGVDYETDVEHASEVARDAMESVDHVEASPPPQVIPNGFEDSAIALQMRYWIDHPTPPRKWRTVSAVVQRVKEAFDDEGIDIPYPQRTVSERNGAAAGAAETGPLSDRTVDGDAGNGHVDGSSASDPDA